MENYICFDTETTSLVRNDLLPLKAQPHIAEFAAVLFSIDESGEGEEIGTLDFLALPGVPITEEITRITGIKPEDVRNMPPFARRASDVREFFAQAGRRCAHNLTFDERMLEFEFARADAGTPWPTAFRQKRLCTVEASEHILGRRTKLSDLLTTLTGETLTGAHRALVDVRATVRCIRAMRKRGDL